MCVHGEQEDDVEIVSVRECFVRLLAYSSMRCGVHQEHAYEHDVACDAAGLGEEDLEGAVWAKKGTLDVEEAVEPLLACHYLLINVHAGFQVEKTVHT